MLPNEFYLQLTRSIRQSSQWSSPAIAIGSGDPIWDRLPPQYSRTVETLASEVYRKPIAPTDITYLDSEDRPIGSVTTRIAFNVTFGSGEGQGTIRECGLYVQNLDDEQEYLVSYFIFPRLEKLLEDTYERQILIDLTPRSSGGGQIITRFLGNSGTRELHDLENEQINCQISEIAFDRRFYFLSTKSASDAGYDYCAHCFGREFSQR